MTTNPGSSEAKRLGCTCPVLDNAYGQGAILDGKIDSAQFYTDPDCPIHRDARLVANDTADNAERGGEVDSHGDAASTSDRRDDHLGVIPEASSGISEGEGSGVAELPGADEDRTRLPGSGTETAP